MDVGLLHDALLANAQGSVPQASGILDPVLEYAGTVAFAISGAIVAAQRRMDPVGVVVLGIMVAVGGGTARDLLLEIPIYWIHDPTFVVLAAVVSLAAVPLYNRGAFRLSGNFNFVNVSDAAGMALFAVTGTGIALQQNANWFTAALLGVISGVGGGMIRDVLANKIPDVLKNGQFYATAAFIGSLVYVGLLQLSIPAVVVVWVPILLIFGIRMVSLARGWGMPTVSLKEAKGSP